VGSTCAGADGVGGDGIGDGGTPTAAGAEVVVGSTFAGA